MLPRTFFSFYDSLLMQLDNRQSLWRKKIDRWLGIPLVFIVMILRIVVLRPLVLRHIFRVPSKNENQKKRILVIKLSALGDAVLMLPSLYRLKQVTGENSEIVFLGGTSNEGCLKLVPAVDKVQIFSLKTCWGLFRRNFDLVIDFDQWVRITAL